MSRTADALPKATKSVRVVAIQEDDRAMVADYGHVPNETDELAAHEASKGQGGEHADQHDDGPGASPGTTGGDDMPSHDAAPSAASPDKMTKLEKLEAELRIMTLAAERAEEKLRLMTMAREHEKEEEEERRTRTGTPKLKHKTPATKSTVGGDRTSGIADEEARAWEEAKIERERRRDEASDLRHALTTTSDERTQFKFEPTRAGIATTLTDFIAR